jgi:hypothetical protein
VKIWYQAFAFKRNLYRYAKFYIGKCIVPPGWENSTIGRAVQVVNPADL